MSENEMLELEQEILEVLTSELQTLKAVYNRGFTVEDKYFLEAMERLERKKHIELDYLGRHPAAKRTFAGYERQALYYE